MFLYVKRVFVCWFAPMRMTKKFAKSLEANTFGIVIQNLNCHWQWVFVFISKCCICDDVHVLTSSNFDKITTTYIY